LFAVARDGGSLRAPVEIRPPLWFSVKKGMDLELSFRPTVQLITVVRRSVISLYERELGDVDASARLGLATHEMLENVLRHSVNGETTLQIRTKKAAGAAGGSKSKVIEIETTNRALPERIETLKAHAAKMAHAGDAETYYLQVMAECAQTDDDGGLGLARIRAEGEMTLNVESEGDVVRVIARTTVGGGAAS
jgi:hypothetical protein